MDVQSYVGPLWSESYPNNTFVGPVGCSAGGLFWVMQPRDKRFPGKTSLLFCSGETLIICWVSVVGFLMYLPHFLVWPSLMLGQSIPCAPSSEIFPSILSEQEYMLIFQIFIKTFGGKSVFLWLNIQSGYISKTVHWKYLGHFHKIPMLAIWREVLHDFTLLKETSVSICSTIIMNSRLCGGALVLGHEMDQLYL